MTVDGPLGHHTSRIMLQIVQVQKGVDESKKSLPVPLPRASPLLPSQSPAPRSPTMRSPLLWDSHLSTTTPTPSPLGPSPCPCPILARPLGGRYSGSVSSGPLEEPPRLCSCWADHAAFSSFAVPVAS